MYNFLGIIAKGSSLLVIYILRFLFNSPYFHRVGVMHEMIQINSFVINVINIAKKYKLKKLCRSHV